MNPGDWVIPPLTESEHTSSRRRSNRAHQVLRLHPFDPGVWVSNCGWPGWFEGGEPCEALDLRCRNCLRRVRVDG